VLDRLLEDDRLAIDAISATSAGAMNAVVMAMGVSLGGRDGARAKLAEFWAAVSRVGTMWSPMPQLPWEMSTARPVWGHTFSPGYLWFEAMTNLFSPYEANPFDFNPLKDVLVATVDFERLRRCPMATRLFICATNVRTGKIRVFENSELDARVVLASACLPHVFKAVEIDGEHYWDGGFMGNPAIFPLIYRGASHDVIVVHVNPLKRTQVPTTAAEIRDRVNEITFNSSLMREMRAIAFVTRLIDDEALDDQRYRRMLVHAIRDDDVMEKFGIESKLSTDWGFLCHLRDEGRRTASQWLETSYGRIGQSTTVDLADLYL
jgi:NTE family protein